MTQEAPDGSPEADQPDLSSQLREAARATDQPETDDGLSLEELRQTYAQLTNPHADSPAAPPGGDPPIDGDQALHPDQALGLVGSSATRADESLGQETATAVCVPDPSSIVEAIIFVGREDNRGITAKEIAQILRGVSEPDVHRLVDGLNEAYERDGQAVRIIDGPDGFHTRLAPDLEFVRERFYGRVRDIALSQSAIDCLALISYQPGISRRKLEEQRGTPSGGVLNQLVRRQLIEMRRVDDGHSMKAMYYPTQKLMDLAGLASLDDLPLVEDLDSDD